MLRSSLHNHTFFCDGHDEIEAFCRAAWEGGFVSLGFSAHAPISKKTHIPSDWHLADDRLEEYLEEVRAARRRWEGKLPVYLGLEVDYITGLMGPADRDYRELGLDFIIGSVHYVFSPQGEPMTVDSPVEEFDKEFKSLFHNDGEALLAAYWDAVAGMITAGGYDILGHLDLVKKNNTNRSWFSPSGENYTRRVRRIAELVAGASGVVEVNTGGLARNYTPDTYPSLEILKICKQQNVPVTINSDAHATVHLAGYHEAAWNTLKQAGYSQVLLFAGGKAGAPVWREDPLG